MIERKPWISQQIKGVLSDNIRRILEKAPFSYADLEEIRVRAGSPLMVQANGKKVFLSQDGMTVKSGKAYVVSAKDVKEMLTFMSQYSLYAYEQEISQGFLTIPGGHRIGLCGKPVVENGKIRNFQYITGLNVRIAHAIEGCGRTVFPYLLEEEHFSNTLILSPPGCGKTTMLRDIIRLCASEHGDRLPLNVSVVDERCEIAACYHGIAQNDLGITADVLDQCPKSIGMLLMLRSMAPDVIAVDEIGTKEDGEAVFQILRCGVHILATMHGSSYDQLKKKPLGRFLLENDVFDRFVILSDRPVAGTVEEVMDGSGNALYKKTEDCAC